jgi:uncharacterized protein involved in tolerance to divalent cations
MLYEWENNIINKFEIRFKYKTELFEVRIRNETSKQTHKAAAML